MMTNYKKISLNIRLVYAVMLAFVMALAVVAEWNVLPLEGALLETFDGTTKYIAEVSLFFLVGLGILVALKGFDWVLRHKVQATPKEKRVKKYQTLNYLRLALLGVLMSLGIFYYYALLDNRGLYCALAGLVASFFCLPSTEGVEVELQMEDK